MKKQLIRLAVCALGAAAMILPTGCSSHQEEETVSKQEEIGPAPGFEGEARISYNRPFDTRGDDEEELVQVDKVILHYHNDDNACLNRRFYTWVTGVDGVERKPDTTKYEWTATDMAIELDYKEITEYADMPSLFFIIKVAGTWAGQSEDIELKYANYTVKDGVLEVWTIPGEGSSIEIYETEAETKFPKILTAKFTDWKTIHCKASDGYTPLYYKLYAFDKSYLTSTTSAQAANKDFYLFKQGKPSGNEFDITFNYTAKINVQYMIESEYKGYEGRVQKIVVSCENLYESARFESYYTYAGDDLGMTYSPTETTFKVWSPVSALCVLNLYDTGTPRSLGGSDASLSYKMNYTAGGVWQVTITNKDLKGKFYTYSVTHSAGTLEAMDPYAKACGINGLRAAVYDKEETNPDGWNSVPSVWDGKPGYDISSPQDLAIYEIHIRDLTMDESWVSNKNNTRGTYKAFAESGTRLAGHSDITTGFDHIEELGVNAIQLLPVFDQDNDERPAKMKFNWGYNPLNYNGVEGGYSSNPEDPVVRIKEYKELIKAYSENNNHTRVIMDVVYNHVSSASASCFTKLMPKYYFRYDANWNYYDGSGCANEVKSDATMMRKYIVDSLTWWATEYKIKGFRFDLMGLIDSWTMRAVKEKMYSIDPDIYVYGEGWTSGGYHGKYELNNKGELINGSTEIASGIIYSQLYESSTSKGVVGGFNNGGRDYLKGENDNGYNGSPYPKWGFMTQGDDVGGKSYDVAKMLKGANPYDGGGENPTQTINYASCHDNYTLWDQLRFTLAPNGYDIIVKYTNEGEQYIPVTPKGTQEPDTLDLVRASLATHAAIFASNGAAFILGGEELYRSKTYEDAEELAKLMEGGADAVVRPFGSSYPQNKHYTTNPDEIQATSEVEMYGKVTSHNSYKSPDSINSFKWDRKVSVNGTDVSAYNKIWSAMIKTHTKVAKYGYPDNMNTASYNVWDSTTYDGSTGLALWNGAADGSSGYYFIFSNRAGATIGFGGFDGFTILYSTRDDYSFSNYKLTLKPFTFICARKGTV